MIKLFMLITTVLLSFSASAGDGSGKVTRIYAHQKNNGSGVIMFALQNHSNSPICSGHEWAFDANNEQGKAMYALLLSAASQGKSVIVKGVGDCSAWGDRERPAWIMVDY
jgi:hypothetical protein